MPCVIVPLASDGEDALLLLCFAAPPAEREALLASASLIGYALATKLENASLRALVRQQAGELRALEHPPTPGARTGTLRRLGMVVDQGTEPRPLRGTLPVEATRTERQLFLPLSVRGEQFGKLLVEDDERQEWDAGDLELINTVAEQMALALEAAALFQESERRAAQLAAAAEIGRAASSLLSLGHLMDTTVEQIRKTFGYYHAQVFLVDGGREWAALQASTGEAGRQLLARRHRLAVGSQSVIGQVTTQARPIVARDTDSSDVPWRFNELLPETRAELAVPLRIGTQVIGALDVQSLEPDAFSSEDIAVLQTLADQLAVAIQNARAYEQQRQTAEELRELDKLKSQFLANMSHELRTPLNSIIGFSRVILKGIDGPITELQRKDLSTIYNSGQILLQLIDSILDISKIEAGKMELDFEEVELLQVIDVAMSTTMGLIKDKPLQLIKEVPDDLPNILADSVRVRQVLLNLLSNAAKFTNEGHIRLMAAQVGDDVMISVEDTGSGIPPDKQQRLFDAFYQVDGSATRKVGGTGLGLAITKSFVEMHGGQIWVESTGKVGQGTTFHVTLPIQRPAQTTKVEVQDAPLVLTMESEPGIALLYERYLTPEGFRVSSCDKAADVVQEASKLQPALILLDLRLHDRAEALLDGLRHNVLTRDIPILLCAPTPPDKSSTEGEGSGKVTFLQKPVLRKELVSAARLQVVKET